MRLNRENTLIENNLYPLAGYHSEQAQEYLVSACTPYKEYFDQVQAGLFLHNVPMYIFLVLFTIVTCVIFSVILKVFGSLTLGIVLLPYFYLYYCFGFVENVFKKYLFQKLPEVASERRDHIRSLEEIFAVVWAPVTWVWRIGFFIYRVFVCPNGIDAVVFILAIFLLSAISKLVNFINLFAFILILLLVLIPVYVRTTLLDKAFEIIKNVISNLVKTIKEKVGKADAPKAEEPKVEEAKAEEPKVEEPKVEEPKVEEPKAEEPKAEEPKAEEPKAEETAPVESDFKPE